MKYIYILYIITILILIYISTKEQFDIVGYNNISLPINKTLSIYDNETTDITTVFNNAFKSRNCDFDKSTYTLYSAYIEFPFNNIIKKMTIDYLKNNINIFSNDKLQINSDINHLYWKNQGDDRIFIFNVNLLINIPRFIVRNIQVKILIKNIKNFMNGNNYRTDIIPSTLISSTDILCIKLDNDNYLSNSMIKGFDQLKPDYHTITNELYLTAPF